MTPRKNYDPRDYDYVRRGEAIGGDIWGWVLATGAAVLFVFLILANYSGTTNTESDTALCHRYEQFAATHTAEHHGFWRATWAANSVHPQWPEPVTLFV